MVIEMRDNSMFLNESRIEKDLKEIFGGEWKFKTNVDKENDNVDDLINYITGLDNEDFVIIPDAFGSDNNPVSYMGMYIRKKKKRCLTCDNELDKGTITDCNNPILVCQTCNTFVRGN